MRLNRPLSPINLIRSKSWFSIVQVSCWYKIPLHQDLWSGMVKVNVDLYSALS